MIAIELTQESKDMILQTSIILKVEISIYFCDCNANSSPSCLRLLFGAPRHCTEVMTNFASHNLLQHILRRP